MKLYYKGTDREVQQGDELTDFRGDKAYAYYWREPNHGVGKISVKRDMNDDRSSGEYYVTCYGLEWRAESLNEEERETLSKAINILDKYQQYGSFETNLSGIADEIFGFITESEGK